MGNACTEQRLKNRCCLSIAVDYPTDINEEDNVHVTPLQTIQPKFFNTQLGGPAPQIIVHTDSERMLDNFTEMKSLDPISIRSIQKPELKVKGILKERSPYRKPFSQKTIKNVHFDEFLEENQLSSHGHINLSKFLTQRKHIANSLRSVFSSEKQ